MIEVKTITVGSLQCNCYLVYDTVTRHAVIIDAGADADLISEYISSMRLDVKHIILTHAHFDHIGAVDKLCKKYNSSIIMNIADRQLLIDPNYNLSSRFPIDAVTVKYPDIKYVTDETMKLIGHDFEFISTPGHSNGSMCIKVDNMIFTGDTLFYCSIGNEFPPFGNLLMEIESIKTKLFTISGDYICYPGHGPKTTLEYERCNNPYIR